jgi:hypothetical protein
VSAGAEELEKRLLLMKKEQKLIQEEAQQAVLQAAASQPAAMAGANVGQPAADMSTPAQVCSIHLGVCSHSWEWLGCIEGLWSHNWELLGLAGVFLQLSRPQLFSGMGDLQRSSARQVMCG